MDERAIVVVASTSDGIHTQLRLTLGEERFEVVEAEGVDSATQLVATRQPSLVVVDADLEGAAELTSSLRARSNGVRVLVLAPRDRDVDEMVREADATVGLPVTSFALLRRIEEVLAK